LDILIQEEKIPEEKIIFLNVVAAPIGIHKCFEKYPNIQFITLMIDEGLNEKSYIVPGFI